MTNNKYTAALLQFVLVLVTSAQASLSGGLDTIEIWQLVALAVASVGTFFLPLVSGPWAGALKTGVAIAGAVVAAIIPLVNGVWNAESGIIVLLAALNALASQIGVSVRLDDVRAQLASPQINNVIPFSVDPKAAQIIERTNTGLLRHAA